MMLPEPDLIVDVTLYPSEAGGRKGPLRGDLQQFYGCPCKIKPQDFDAWDSRFTIDGEIIQPGETRRLGVRFLSRERAMPLFQNAGIFYLWEGRIIGEARVIQNTNSVTTARRQPIFLVVRGDKR